MLKYFLKNSGQRTNFIAVLFWAFSVIGSEICMLIGGMVAGALTSWVALIIGVGIALSVLIGCYLTAMQLQCLAEGAGGLSGTRAVENAGDKMQFVASLLLALSFAVLALTPLAGLGLSIWMKNGWVFVISLIAVLPAAIAAWMNALAYKCLGDMAGGERKIRSSLLRGLLNNAGSKMQLLASISLLVTAVCSVLLLIAGLVWAVAADSGLLVALVVAGVLLLAFSGWLAAQYAQALGDAASGAVHVTFAFFKPFLSHAAGTLHRAAALILAVVMALAAIVVIGGIAYALGNLNPTLSEAVDYLADTNPALEALANEIAPESGNLKLSEIIEQLEPVDPAMADAAAGWRKEIRTDAFKTAGLCALGAAATFLGAWVIALQLQALSDAAEKRR